MSCSESQIKAVRRWQAKNKDKVREINNKWRKDNPDKIIKSRSKTVSNTLYLSAKHRANKSGLDFGLDKFDIVIPEYCPYLKTPITTVFW